MFAAEVKWVRIFDVPDTTKHSKGFTIYKVVSMLYPENCPNAVTKITAWKRFNDFKKLHKDIKALHKSLKIKDQVPNLPTASYFKRFDEDVIQHRKEIILGLLEYISIHAQLFTSNMFVKFFETSHLPDEEVHGDSDEDCTISDDTDSLSTVSSSMIQLTDEALTKSHDYPINLRVFIGDLQLYACELFGNSLGADLIEAEYICHADRFFELAAEIEQTHREFKVAWRHYMQGIYILLKYGKEDKSIDRKQTAKFKLEKYLIRIEKLFYLHLYDDIKTFLIGQYGEPFAHVALADANNLHVEQLFDLQKFEAKNDNSGDGALMVLAEVGGVRLIGYPIRAAALRASPYDSEDFVLLANKYENEQRYAAAYVNYKMAFADVYKYLKTESKDLTYLLRNEAYVYRGEESLNAGDDKEAKEVQLTYRRGKNAELYNYKVVELLGGADARMLVLNTETEQTFCVRVVQKPVGFAHDCLIFPKHVPYMTKLQRWHTTEDAIFLLFNYTKATNIKEYLLKYTNCDNDNNTKETVNEEDNDIEEEHELQLSSNSEEFEFLDLPSGSAPDEQEDIDEYLEQRRFVPMEKIERWIAQAVLAIERLHKCGVICCDLRMADLSIDENEDLLIDYKFKLPEKKVYSYKEEGVLMAPEVYTFEMVTPAADWWALGVILYELIVGVAISTINPDGFFTYPIVRIPKYISQRAKSLIKQLLIFEPNIRLGAGGSEQVKSHPFFNHIDWNALKL